MIPLIDSNILIDHFKGIPAATQELSSYGQFAISSITWIETLVGARDASEERCIRAVLQQAILIETNSEIRERALLLRRHRRLRLPDAIILATAEIRETLLVTRNTKDFDVKDARIRVPYHL